MSSTPTTTPPSSRPSTPYATLRSFSPFGRRRALPKSPPPVPVLESLGIDLEPLSPPCGSRVAPDHHKSSSEPQALLMMKSSPECTSIPLPESEYFGLATAHSKSHKHNDGNRRKKKNDFVRTLRSTVGSDQSASCREKPARPPRKRKCSAEEESVRHHTKKRVAVAAKSVLGTTADVTHELLYLGGDFLAFAPIPGLAPAARALLQIWDALDDIDANAMSCLRLTERCAETLLAVRQEIHQAGDLVTEELHLPLTRLQEGFDRVRQLMVKEATRTFIKRYLNRYDVMKEIADCDTNVREALDVFNISVSIRILKQSKESELQRQAETRELLAAILDQRNQHEAGNALMLTGVSEPVASSSAQNPQQPVAAPPPVRSDQTSASKSKTSFKRRSVQDSADRARDAENLRQLISLALQTTNDAELLELFQIKRQEMPHTIKAFQKGLERIIKQERKEARRRFSTLLMNDHHQHDRRRHLLLDPLPMFRSLKFP